MVTRVRPLAALFTLAEVESARVGHPILKGPTRLDDRIADTRDEQRDERRWRQAVIAFDGHRCRCCGRRVVQTLGLGADRLQTHHVTSRADPAVRWDVRNGMVLCSECHAQLTPHRMPKSPLVIVQTEEFQFTVGGKAYINARQPLTFEPVGVPAPCVLF